MKTSPRLSLLLAPVALAATTGLAFLTGCAGFTGTAAAPIAQQLHVTGSVFGGQQPVSGAKVYLYTVSGRAGVISGNIETTSAGYVTSDANGNFNLNGDYTCPQTTDSNGNTTNLPTPTYLLALGGNPGLTSGTNNTAIALMAALGPCSGLSSSTIAIVNEVSTAAAVTALQQFMTDETHIGASTINVQPGYSDPLITNAMTTVNSLVSLPSGVAVATPAAGAGVSPVTTLNTLGNILASCINSLSASSTPCAALFAAVTPTGGTTPTDTIGAMLLIAKNPGRNVAAIYALAGSNAPFQPSLTTAPNDFTLGITYTGLSYPGQVIVDNAGDVFVANCPTCNGVTGTDTVQGFTPSGSTKLAATAVINPTAMAIDRYNNIWVTESTNGTTGNQVTRFTYDTGTLQSGFPVALNGVPGGIALIENEGTYPDAPASAWITDTTNGRIVLVNPDGTAGGGVNTTGISSPTAIAADGLENLYVIGTGSTSILEYGPVYDRTQLYGTLTPAAVANLTSTTLSGASAGFSTPVSLSIDGGNHLWTVDTGTSAVSELFTYNGAVTGTSGTSGFTGVINSATNVTIDGAGTAWIANCRKNCTGSGSTAVDNVVHLSAAGASLTTSDGFQNAAFAKPTGTAIDLSGNLWITNTGGNSLTELVGVAAPVVTELQGASSRHALPATNYLANPNFEFGTGVNVTSWTTSSNVNTCATPSEDTGSPFSGSQKLTFYCGYPYSATAAQTITGLTSGNYLVSCYIAGAPNSSTQTATIMASGFGGTAMTTTATGLTYTFQPYSLANVPVSNGTLTVTIGNADSYVKADGTGGGYGGFDSCSVTKQ